MRDLIKRKAKAEQPPKDIEVAPLGLPDDPLGRGVPRSTMRGFFAGFRSRSGYPFISRTKRNPR
jgi:hypothetical protein